MRTLLCLFALALVASAQGADDKPDSERLQGDWTFAEFVNDGEKTQNFSPFVLRVVGEKMRLVRDGKEVENAEFGFKIDAAVTPKLIDLVLGDDRTLEGIYKLEDKTWTLTLRADASVKDRPVEFASPPNSRLVLVVLKRLE